jgi:hypothetical protein
MTDIIVFQFNKIGGAAVGATDAVYQEIQLFQAQFCVEAPCHFYNLGIDYRVAVADGLVAELMVLAQSAGLRSFVSEYGR